MIVTAAAHNGTHAAGQTTHHNAQMEVPIPTTHGLDGFTSNTNSNASTISEMT